MRPLEEIVKDLPEDIRFLIYEAFQAFQRDVLHKEVGGIKEEIKRIWETIDKILEAIDELKEAQRRTEEEIRKLAEAQRRTEEEIKKLVEAQKRTEEELKKLSEEHKETRRMVENLIDEHKDTRQKLENLIVEHKETRNELKNLIEDHRKTREQLAGLSHAIGYTLEDRAIKSLPKILKKQYGIEVIGRLRRTFIELKSDAYIEVNIFGNVRKGKRKLILIGESKTRVSKKDLNKFLAKCKLIAKHQGKKPEDVVKVFISYLFTPDIIKYAKEKDIILVQSDELEF